MKNSLLFLSVIFVSNIFANQAWAASKMNACIKGEDKIDLAFSKIYNMYAQSKKTEKYLFSYAPSIELSKDVLLKAVDGLNDTVWHEEVSQLLRLDTGCDADIFFSYFGDSKKDILLKKGLRMSIDSFKKIDLEDRQEGARADFYFIDRSRKITIRLFVDRTCKLQNFVDFRDKKDSKLSVNFAAPSTAIECKDLDKPEEISEQQETRRKSNSRGV